MDECGHDTRPGPAYVRPESDDGEPWVTVGRRAFAEGVTVIVFKDGNLFATCNQPQDMRLLSAGVVAEAADLLRYTAARARDGRPAKHEDDLARVADALLPKVAS